MESAARINVSVANAKARVGIREPEGLDLVWVAISAVIGAFPKSE
jgi:hypothetical protein